MIGLASKIFKRLSINKYYISVYEGISPSLLATMSLSQGVKGKTNQQLISSLVKSNIIQNKILESAMQKYDRQLFISRQLNKISNLYENKPYRISGGQNMTDIFTHAVILEQVCYWLQKKIDENLGQQGKNIRVLDIGCGHGYLSFVISQFFRSILASRRQNWKYSILGIDTNLQAIQYCKNLKKRLSQERTNFQCLQFKAQAIESLIGSNQSFDCYIGGFYMPPALHEGVLKKMKQEKQKRGNSGFGIWATDSPSGQSLYTYTTASRKEKAENKQDKKNEGIVQTQIMSTMFSMPVTKTSVSKFFFQDGQNEENPQQSLQVKQRRLEQLKKLKHQKRKQEREKTKEILADKISQYSKKLNKKLTLSDMRNIPEINELLAKLNQK